MDKNMSTRMDEAVIRQIGMLAAKPVTTKKAVIENAIRHYFEKIEADQGCDVLADTFGTWEREESAQEAVQTVKKTMRKSQERYKR